MEMLVFFMCFGLPGMATIVICDLKDSKTHRWKPPKSRKQYVGYAIVLVLPLAAFATFFMTRR